MLNTPRWLLPALVLAAATGVFFSPGRGLEAHALLVRADPPVNAQLREPPSQLTLYFSEPLEQRYSRVSVYNSDGVQVDDGFEFLAEDDAAMRVSLPPLEPGYLRVDWETVSTVDGHRITGTYYLTLLNEDGSLPAGEPPGAEATTAGDQPNPLRVLTKWVLLLAGSLLAGSLVFVAYVWRPRQEGDERDAGFRSRVLRTAFAALVLVAVAGVVELLLQANDIGAGAGSVLGTQWGERWLYRNLALIPIAVLLAGLSAGLAQPRLNAALAIILAAFYMLLTASVSHAGAGGGSFWAIGADFVHLMASSVWIGTLGLLALLFAWARATLEPHERPDVIAGALQRFSLVAAVSVGLLLFTGIVNAIVELGRFEDLVDTAYGRALGLKLLLLFPLLGIAAYNAYLLRPDYTEAADSEKPVRDRQTLLQELDRQLNRRIRYELLFAVAVLAVVALLVQLTPTRGRLAMPEAGPGEFIETITIEDLQITLVITPNEPGFNTFELYLAGGVDRVEGLRLEFTNPGGFLAETRLQLDPSNPPTFYIGQGPFLSEPGRWNVLLNIRRDTGFDLRPVFQVNVRDTAPAVIGSSRSGGAFDSPVPFSPVTVTLLALSGLLSVAVVVGSLPRPGLPEGYLGWLAAEMAYRVGPVNVRPVWTLGALVVGGIALGLILGNHLHPPLSQEEASRENPIPATEESIARGALLFSQNCAICHGETGRGDGPAAPSLPLQPANLYDHVPYHPDQFFFGVITLGLSGVMPGFEGTISEEDRWNLLNFLRATFTQEPSDR